MAVTTTYDLETLKGPELSLEEWAELPEDVPGEIVEGRLVEEEVPEPPHELVIAYLVVALGTWGEASGAMVFTSGLHIAVGQKQGRKPDLSVYFAGRRPSKRALVTLAPDLAVEVVSPGAQNRRRDRVHKFAEYANFGIRWYWLVDPEARTLEVYELSDEGYSPRLSASEGALAIPGCDGLELNLDSLWQKLDELG